MSKVLVVFNQNPEKVTLYYGDVRESQLETLRRHHGVYFNINNTDAHDYALLDAILQSLKVLEDTTSIDACDVIHCGFEL